VSIVLPAVYFRNVRRENFMAILLPYAAQHPPQPVAPPRDLLAVFILALMVRDVA